MAIDSYRSAHAERTRHATMLGADETWGMASSPTSASAEVEDDETIALVWRSIGTLSDLQRSVMALRWQAQLSFDEIASVLGMSPPAVRMQHSRALARLRAILPAHLTDDR
jgi:RNA polymerase sigma factor (sigma-70 family)